MLKKVCFTLSILLFLIVIFNSIVNFLKFSFSINFFDILASFLLFIFLLSVGKLVDLSLNFKNISVSILVYLFSFFILDIILLFFTTNIDFNEIFIITNIFWTILFIVKLQKKFFISFPIISLIFLKYFFYKLSNLLTINNNIKGDVEAVFFDQTKNIYEYSYFFSINNHVMEGYPQFTSYLQALFLQIAQQQGLYNFYSFTSYLVFYLSVLFFLELKVATRSKFLLITLFTSLILNSDWLRFLFTSSLMSEGIVSLFTGVGFYYLLNNVFKSKIRLSSYLFCFNFGILYFTKQFNSSIVLIVLIALFLIDRKNKALIFGFSGLILKELLYLFIFTNIEKDHHIRQIDVVDTFFDLLLIRDLKLNNILIILKNLFIDKPFTIVLLVFYISFTLLIFNSFKESEINYYLFFIVNLNLLFVFALYISVWQNMELDSPIRYFLNLLHLTLVSTFLNIDKYYQKTIYT